MSDSARDPRSPPPFRSRSIVGQPAGSTPETEGLATRVESLARSLAAFAGRAERLQAEALSLNRELRELKAELATVGSEAAVNGPGAPASAYSQGMRLLVTQMIAGGSTREEIEERMRAEFGSRAAESVVADAFPAHSSGPPKSVQGRGENPAGLGARGKRRR